MSLKLRLSAIAVLIVLSFSGYSFTLLNDDGNNTNAPDLSYLSHIIDDDDNDSSSGDGDGQAEGGETIEMPLQVVNSGDLTAHNVTASLFCADTDITVTDNSEGIGDVSPGATAWTQNDFDFIVVAGCPEKDVEFIVTFTADEGVWQSSFTIHIFPSAGLPILSYNAHTIDDDDSGSSLGDGDGLPESGETIEVPIQILNSGGIAATSVTATISTSDSDINITDAFEYYPNISAGDAVWCENDFDMEISANCPEKDVLFTMNIESSQGSWTSTFIIHFFEQGSPHLSFVQYIIDDDNNGNSSGNDNGLAEPSEHIELPILIANTGAADAHNVSAVLSTTDPDISVTDANENYGTIDAGTSEWSNNEFDIIVNNSCPEKDVVFTLTITSDEGSWSSNFIIHIFDAGSPNLIYANHLIDDDNDGSSNGNGNGLPEASEEIEMPVSITNVGLTTAHNTIAYLSCADPDIIITDNEEGYGTIAVGEEVWCALDYDFDIAYGAPEKDVLFNLLIQSDEGSWTDSFIVHIYAATEFPILQYADHIINDDNGNGIPEAGEAIELPVLLENIGTITANDITTVLTCADPDIDIIDANEDYPDIDPGETAWSNYAFDFNISPTCPDKTVIFTITITSDEGNWVSTFPITIVGSGDPNLIFNEFVIDDDDSGASSGDGDGQVEPGETIELSVSISNNGNSPVNDVMGYLSTSDPDITITDFSESFGDLVAGEQSWSANDFNFEVSLTCPQKDVLFSLYLIGTEGEWTVTFYVHVTTNTSYIVETIANPTNAGTTTGDGAYLDGEYCTVEASANEGFEFINWTHNGAVVSTLPNYVFVVSENTTLIANFLSGDYLVTVEADPIVGGTVSGGGLFQYGEIATVVANANDNYSFVEWTSNGNIVSNDANYSFEVTENTSLIAHFQGDMHTISISANPSNGGTVSGGGEYEHGTTATITAIAINDYGFINWTEDGNILSLNPVYTFEVLSNRTLIANFSEEYYVIDAIAVPSNAGTIDGAGNYIDGQNATLVATANTGYFFTEWKENGNTVSTNPSYTFLVTENRSLEAHFGTYDYIVTVSAVPEQGGTVSGGGGYDYGDEATVIAVPNLGWEFLSWVQNGNVMSMDAEYTFTVTTNISLQAIFIIQEFTITASVDPGDGGSVIGDGIYEYGEYATLIADPADSHIFINWTENGNVVSDDIQYSFMVTSDRSLVAHFFHVTQVNTENEIVVNVFPNPSNGLFHIAIDETAHVELIDSKGQTIKAWNLDKGKTQLNISNEADGLYFLKISTQDHIKVLKLLKE